VGILDRILGRGGSSSRLGGADAGDPTAPLPGLEAALAASPRDQIELLRRAVAFCEHQREAEHARAGTSSYTGTRALSEASELANRLLRRKLPFTPDDLVELLERVLREPCALSQRSMLRAIERYLDGAKPAGALRTALESAEDTLRSRPGSEPAELAQRVASLLSGAGTGIVELEPVDAWTRGLLARFAEDPDLEEAAAPLLRHAATATTSRPNTRWEREVAEHVALLGAERHRSMLTAVLEAVGTTAVEPLEIATVWVHARHADLLRGLVWSAAVDSDASVALALGDAAERCFRKVAGTGPRAPRIANACLNALAAHGSREAAAQLSRLALCVKHASSRRSVENALARVAERTGMSPAELAEVAVPTAGLRDVGLREELLGDLTAELRLRPGAPPEIAWRRPDGQYQKRPPVTVEVVHAEAIAALKTSAAELRKLVPAQAARLERQLLEPRSLACDEWRQRYADHPVVGFLTRRLIWWVGEGDAAVLASFDREALVDIDGKGVQPHSGDRVRLWHPIESNAEIVHAWREVLGARRITQPFKQAHRELYRLSDAERRTSPYSSRFAGRVLRQSILQALCRERGWQCSLQGPADTPDVLHRELPGGWRQELHVKPAPAPEDTAADVASPYVASAEVCFRGPRRVRRASLRDVPPLLFSEGMRDVDLFVSAASVAHALDLGELAHTRREALQQLVPQLASAERCTLDDGFLCVRGDLRLYRIDLRSANVQMSPNDEELRIAPRAADPLPATLLLPFEGDRALSLILSRASLLAADSRIRDRHLASQIRRFPQSHRGESPE